MSSSEITSHYIVLVQVSDTPESKTFSEYDSLYACMEGITRLYDDFIKQVFPHEPELIYDMASVVKFVDKCKDLSCLVYHKKSNMYKPQGKKWVMQELYKHLLKAQD